MPRDTRRWTEPHPNATLMSALGVVNRWMFLHGVPGLRSIPGIRDLPLVHGYFWVRDLEIPTADLERLRSTVNRDTVAFLGPNHPEFGTDWMIDKEISTIVAPMMASWADRSIVAAAPKFWGMNNLVANDGGEDAKSYSVEWARRGSGVLLHPEGSVRWTGDMVHPLFPGIAQMAIAAAKDTAIPVYVVPVVWKYRYVGNVRHRIQREMQILEHGLAMPSVHNADLGARFKDLQENVLTARMRQFGYGGSAVPDFFHQQLRFQRWLVDDLEKRHSIEHSDDVDKRIVRLARAIRTELSTRRGDIVLKRDLAMADEAKRLGEFSKDCYGSATLTQEHLFESLKRMRDRLLKRDWKDALANILPRPFGPRIVHVGVPEPIRVDSSSTEANILETARNRMQASLDAINARIAPDVARYSIPNPFARRSVA